MWFLLSATWGQNLPTPLFERSALSFQNSGRIVSDLLRVGGSRVAAFPDSQVDPAHDCYQEYDERIHGPPEMSPSGSAGVAVWCLILGGGAVGSVTLLLASR